MIRDGKRTGHKQGGERGQRKNERWKENRRQTGRKKRTERTMSDGSRKEGGHIGKKGAEGRRMVGGSGFGRCAGPGTKTVPPSNPITGNTHPCLNRIIIGRCSSSRTKTWRELSTIFLTQRFLFYVED